MAIYHLRTRTASKGHKGKSLKSGKTPHKAASHYKYIARLDQYAAKGGCLWLESGRMPAWAEGKPSFFWSGSDRFERANGRVFREFVFALPKELGLDEWLEMSRDYIERLIPAQPYSFAVHCRGGDADGRGGHNPHVHLMFSERVMDGLPRSRKQFFSRYCRSEPAKGGARKNARFWRSGWLVYARKLWEEVLNSYLEKYGVDDRVSADPVSGAGIIPMPALDVVSRLSLMERQRILSDALEGVLSDEDARFIIARAGSGIGRANAGLRGFVGEDREARRRLEVAGAGAGRPRLCRVWPGRVPGEEVSGWRDGQGRGVSGSAVSGHRRKKPGAGFQGVS